MEQTSKAIYYSVNEEIEPKILNFNISSHNKNDFNELERLLKDFPANFRH